ncbi:ROK family protein [Microbacterium gorillae]|uniref:ROK family protein n=1 Tax=Microbacterium gorillae TaxID=1231063 RepID=UPI001E51AF22|nr:ROK family protein [Microbacterium gorillae]
MVLAIDIGGTKVEAALVDQDGTVRAGSRVRRPTGRDIEPIAMRAALAEVITEATAAPGGEAVLAVGVGTAGPFRDAGGVIAPVNMPGLNGFRLAEEVAGIAARDLGRELPVRVGHDGSCLAVAEAWIGATAGSTASMSIVVSTGIGGGIVIDGVLIAGASGNAGHLGQTHISGEGLTLEEVASGPASVAWARARGWRGTSGEDLARDAAAGDETARAAIVRSARAVGAGLSDAITLLDLEVVSIGGGFSQAAPDYIELVQEGLAAAAVLDYARSARIVRSGLHGDGPLVGAAAIALRSAGALS